MLISREYDFTALKNNSWSGAVNTLDIIEAAGREDELMSFLEELFYEKIPTETDINDFLWFESELIFETLDIDNSDNEDSEE